MVAEMEDLLDKSAGKGGGAKIKLCYGQSFGFTAEGFWRHQVYGPLYGPGESSHWISFSFRCSCS